MKTRLSFVYLAVVSLALAGSNLAGCNRSLPKADNLRKSQYTCPMHPEVVKDLPGDCPKCGMKLIAKP